MLSTRQRRRGAVSPPTSDAEEDEDNDDDDDDTVTELMPSAMLTRLRWIHASSRISSSTVSCVYAVTLQ